MPLCYSADLPVDQTQVDARRRRARRAARWITKSLTDQTRTRPVALQRDSAGLFLTKCFSRHNLPPIRADPQRTRTGSYGVSRAAALNPSQVSTCKYLVTSVFPLQQPAGRCLP